MHANGRTGPKQKLMSAALAGVLTVIGRHHRALRPGHRGRPGGRRVHHPHPDRAAHPAHREPRQPALSGPGRTPGRPVPGPAGHRRRHHHHDALQAGRRDRPGADADGNISRSSRPGFPARGRSEEEKEPAEEPGRPGGDIAPGAGDRVNGRELLYTPAVSWCSPPSPSCPALGPAGAAAPRSPFPAIR